MSDGPSGWRTLQQPHRPGPAGSSKSASPARSVLRPTSAFARLARVQALSAAGDAMIAVALAGSLFFSIDPSAARWRVGLYLAFTVAPFAVVGPLIGPALDRARGGRRMMITLVNGARAVTALLMITNIDTLLLFPLAFTILVGGKSYAVGKAALVPTVVRDHAELVDANSRLALVTGLAGAVGAAPAALASLVFGPSAAVAFAALTFGAATVMSWQLPSTAVAAMPADQTEQLELQGVGIRLAGSAMGILRGIVGYLTFLVAFAFRGGTDDVDLSGVGTAFGAGARNAFGFEVGSDTGVPAWQLGVVLGFNMVGILGGSLLAPRIRRSTPEENILLGVLVVLAGVAGFGAWSGDLTAASLVALAVGLAASAGKQAFDSIVQRDAPDANYGRSFARFETRFQVYWVLGALLPVVITTPAGLGFGFIGLAAAVAAVTYFLGSRGATAPRRPRRRREGADRGRRTVDDAESGGGELSADDLRPSYPQMSLRSPVRAPSGWSSTPGGRPGDDGDVGAEVDTTVESHPPSSPPSAPPPGPGDADHEGDGGDGQLPLWER